MDKLHKPSSIQNQNRHSEPPLRIADILNSATDDHQFSIFNQEALMGMSKNCPNTIECSTPGKIVSIWLSGLRWFRVKRERDGKVLPKKVMEATCSKNCLKETEIGQRSGNDGAFNLGLGCSLLYLIAESRNELSKMVDMRMKMEALLQNTREELVLDKKDERLEQFDSEPKHDKLFAYSSASNDVGTESNAFESPTLEDESSRVTIYNHSLMWETPQKEAWVEHDDSGADEKMEQLQAELEFEFERLQLHMESENFLKHLDEENMVKVSDEYTSSSKDQTLSSGEVINPQFEEDTCTENGVSPIELERRLHELLEARQQEQIRELEATLECLKQKLLQKEMEVSWWKDAATLISNHAIEPSKLTPEQSPGSSSEGALLQICDEG